MKLSFESLVERLIHTGNDMARNASLQDRRLPTSLRLKPATQHWLQCQAKALDTSFQSVISMILDGVAEIGAAPAPVDPTLEGLRTIRKRFFHVFRSHDLDLPSLVSIMKPHGFSLSVLGDEARSLALLNQESLSHVAEAFYIEKDWLTGSSDYTAKTQMYWYKNLYQAGQKLLEFGASGLDPQVIFIKRDKAKLSDGPDDYSTKPMNPSGTEHIGILVRLSCRAESGVRYQAYQLWDFADWVYSRSRAQIKALIAFCSRAQSSGLISYTGGVLSEAAIEDLLGCKVLPVDVMKTMPHYNWHPQDCVSDEMDKERVWSVYKEYELDDLLGKYEFKRSERL